MAKTTTALFSEDAKGTFGKILCYAHTQSNRIVKKKPHPKQPNTQAQLTQKLLMKLWSKLWRQMSPESQAEWNNSPGDQSISGYHRFMKFQSDNMNNGDGIVSKYEPTSESGNPSVLNVELDYTNSQWHWKFEVWNPEYLCGLFVALDPASDQFIRRENIIAGFAVPSGKLQPIGGGSPMLIDLYWPQPTEEPLNFYADCCNGDGIFQGIES